MHKETYKKQNLSVSGLQWKVKKNINDNIKKIEKIKNISEVIKNILLKRDLFSMDIQDYLSPSLNTLTPNPLSLHDMSKAAKACHDAIIKKQKIGILGDYDVDGATSSALPTNSTKPQSLSRFAIVFLRAISLEDRFVFLPSSAKSSLKCTIKYRPCLCKI